MAKRIVESPQAMKALVGQELGVSDWLVMTQERINTFAEASGDHQWIHVDVERCKTDMPDGKTIAHGNLTFSLFWFFFAYISRARLRAALTSAGVRPAARAEVPPDTLRTPPPPPGAPAIDFAEELELLEAAPPAPTTESWRVTPDPATADPAPPPPPFRLPLPESWSGGV